MSIHARHLITPIINASGPVTRLGGARQAAASLSAYAAAATQSVVLDEVQAAASRAICAVTQTEAALVTCGASAGLMLGAAAILCRHDLRRMEQLPDLQDAPRDLLVARGHRHGYDHALRAAGARLVEVGMDEVHAHAGVRRTDVWEFEQRIDGDTAGIFYTQHAAAQPPLADVVDRAHRHGLPVLVDAAAQLPPASNLTQIPATGADLVVFSGGKALAGPQATGILCGRRDLVGSAFLQMMDQDEHWELWEPPTEFVDKSQLVGIPRHGIGRALKVSQEQVLALLAALDQFLSDTPSDTLDRHLRWLGRIVAKLERLDVTASIRNGSPPELHIQLPSHAPVSAMQICRALRNGDPRVFIGHGRLHDNMLVVHPGCLCDEQIDPLAQRIATVLANGN